MLNQQIKKIICIIYYNIIYYNIIFKKHIKHFIKFANSIDFEKLWTYKLVY